jgi:type IV pilus assembly protein PilA
MEPQSSPRPPAAPSATKTSGLALASLLLGIAGMLLGCPAILSVLFGLLALIRIRQDPQLGGRGLAVAGLVISLVVVPIEAILVLPLVRRQIQRSTQEECSSHLVLLIEAERYHARQHGAFSTDPVEVGFTVERGNRYAYFLSATGEVQDRSKAEPTIGPGTVGYGVDTRRWQGFKPVTQADLPPLTGGALPGISGTCPDCTFVGVCATNLDSDPTLDVWSVSTRDRTGAKGEHFAAGIPVHDVDDVSK